MTSLLGTLTIDAVCVIAATLRHAVHATSFAVVYLCVVGLAALLLARIFIFRWPGAVKAAALAVAVAAYAPFAHPLEPFDMAPYDEFPVQKASQIPGMPRLLLANETLTTGGPWFRDSDGRVLLLRGVNLGGITKLPAKPDGASYRNHSKFRTAPGDVSFVGRPFPLAEADEHFTRLRAWGLTFIRLLITWEAVEHDGPGVYDEKYLRYLLQLVRKADEYGIVVFIDPHQDVWSRWTGGSGAPAWTLEAAGFDLMTIEETGAALTHQHYGDPLPKMIWGTNNWRLATATMFTLFFAGNDYAPKTKVGGVPIQDYLQDHFVAMAANVALTLRNERNVVGFDTLNEVSSGRV